MNKEIWIFNHYATHMFFDRGGRHYWFAKMLTSKNYNVTIFTASTNHYSNNDIVIEKGISKIEYIDNIKFVFIKTPKYNSNGFKRILNMILFYNNSLKTVKAINLKPDVILASSPHPLTLILGIKIAKKYKVDCISEIRDLWPESIVDYGLAKKDNILVKLMYKGEKFIYEKSDKLIFTIEGGKDYIKDKKWDIENRGKIDLKKIFHINNGVNINEFDFYVDSYLYEDDELNNTEIFKIIYTGSIRKANNIDLLIETAKYIASKNVKDIKFYIFGQGNEKFKLEQKCKNEEINNVVFKGHVEKKFIPSILSKSNINILNYIDCNVWKYGGSQNKLFEYLVAGKPIINTVKTGYDVIKKYDLGISIELQTPEMLGEAILKIKNLSKDEHKAISVKTRKLAEEFDFEVLTDKLIKVIENSL